MVHLTFSTSMRVIGLDGAEETGRSRSFVLAWIFFTNSRALLRQSVANSRFGFGIA